MTINTADLSIGQLRSQITGLRYILASSLPDKIAEDWLTASSKPSPVEALALILEPAYAFLKSETTPNQDLAVTLGQIAYVLYFNNFFALTDRALEIYTACRRATGETIEGTDPEIDEAYKPVQDIQP